MIRIEINTDNAAFDGDDERVEVARILRDLSYKIEGQYNSEVIMDVNGNRCGTLEVL